MAMIAVPVSKDIGRLFRGIDVPGNRDYSDHVTVIYLGKEFPIDKIAKLIEPLYNQIKKEKPFNISCENVISFEKGKHGYPIIAELKSTQLEKLRNKIIQILEDNDINFNNDNPTYKPHVTLSYSKTKPAKIKFPKISWQINEIAIFGGDESDEKLFVSFPFSLDIPQKSAAYISELTNIWKNTVEKF